MGFDTFGPTQRPRPARPVTVATVVGGIDARQRQDDRRLPGKDRVSGTPVYGSSSVQQFEISSPGADGFTITLPGGATLAWQATLAVRATGAASVTLRTRMSSTLGTPISLDGTNSMSASDFATFYGGDDITCEAVLTGATGGPFTVTVDFAAIRLS